MTIDELRTYNVIVNDGSGCLFEPESNKQYMYILTAKHIFEGNRKDQDGADEEYNTPDGTSIDIKRFLLSQTGWQVGSIPFILDKGKTYFPHNDVDAAILKIPYLDSIKYDKIFLTDIESQEYKLYGYPEHLRNKDAGENDTSYPIKYFEGTGSNTLHAQLENFNLNKDHIQGMSGGGILKVNDKGLSLIGIQSNVKHSLYANGKIGFISIKHFREIINENTEKLSLLNPPYLEKFEFLKDQAFKLDVDQLDENAVTATRMTLRNKALEIINSNITPFGIKELFKERLLISEEDKDCLSQKNIWIAWLEFLVIINIVKNNEIQKDELSDIFDSYRLKYSKIDDWTKLINKDLITSDYIGLTTDSTVIISTQISPRRTYKIPKGKMINIANVYDKSGFKTDRGLDPYTSFNFVHLDYFKEKCILNKLEVYKNLNETEIIKKLRDEYNDLFH